MSLQSFVIKAITALFLLLVAAGDTIAASSFRWVQVFLSSGIAGVAPRLVPDLTDPWGIARAPSGSWWVAVNDKGLLLRLDREGPPVSDRAITRVIVPLPVRLRYRGTSRPTGVIYNTTRDFLLNDGRPAQLIAVTQDGTVAAWNSGTGKQARLVADNSSFAVYTGLALAGKDGKNYLFAANFRTGTIDIFDTYFHQLPSAARGVFSDASLPRGYAPFNVRFIGGRLFVLYALQDADRYNPEPGVGARPIRIYSLNGNLQRRPESGNKVRSAWAAVNVPADFGNSGSMLLLANNEDGTVASIDLRTGAFAGYLKKPDGNLVTIPGIFGMEWDGPGSRRLYFCSRMTSGKPGLFGFIAPEP